MAVVWNSETEYGQGLRIGCESVTAPREKRLQQVLDQFSKVFQEPKGLPPSKIPIELGVGVDPVNVGPYMYP